MRSLARGLGVVLAVAALAWLCTEAAPGSATERAARVAGLLPADDSTISPADRAAILDAVAQSRQLHGSAPRRLGRTLLGLASLDFGRSWRDGEPVRPRLARSLLATLTLILASLLVAVALGVGLGALSVRRVGGPLDLAASFTAALAIATPPAWLATLALRTFATGSPWRWLPSGGFDSFAAALLPVLCLAAVPAFVVARHTRAALVDALASPWATAALARGASRTRVVAVHGLRASLAGLVSIGVTAVAYLLGSSLIVERVFRIHGLGDLMLDAAARGDAPVVVGVTVTASALLALTSIAADLARPRLDPRLRASAPRPHRAA